MERRPSILVRAGGRRARQRVAWPLTLLLAVAGAALTASPAPPTQAARDGDGAVEVSGEAKQWHKVTLTLDGPFARERDTDPNPFVDLRMTVSFAHESGTPAYEVPGYFAADGNAAESSAEAGTKWRAHLSPDVPGEWTWEISFVRGDDVALHAEREGEKVAPFDGGRGRFTVAATDKRGRDLRARGRLQYVGKHHLRFAGSGEYFLKAGPDAPETLLAYRDFDGTATRKTPLKSWQPHERDWQEGDPTWKEGSRGRGLIGALNYLAARGLNAVSFLPYNAGGDGDNVWPFVAPAEKLHYDCSKLDQWGIVFDHAQRNGLYLHFKLQETEIDDNRHGEGTTAVPAALDGGALGPERRLYCREMIARFAHCLALNWNLGEENTQSPAEQRDMARYISELDPYSHHIVVHTYPNQQEKVYTELLGDQSVLTGASLQNGWSDAHRRTVQWVRESARAGRPWVVANDEQGPASHGVPPDPGFEGFDGTVRPERGRPYDLHSIRKHTLWGTLLAGGAGVEYYFGYELPQNDLVCEDWRSRERSWEYCRIALEFFNGEEIPFWDMSNADALVGNPEHTNERYCLARPGEVYLVYLPEGGSTQLDLREASGAFEVRWFDPRNGGEPARGTVTRVSGGEGVSLGDPPRDAGEDWLAVVRRR